jgi:hypothetical protein
MEGLQGIEGPTGKGFVGPKGCTGPTGFSMTGPTGRGCPGPTGPAGPLIGLIGPIGPPNQFLFSNLQYDASNTSITIPTQTSPIVYYNILINNDVNFIDAKTNNLPSGYQAILIINSIGSNNINGNNINGNYNLHINNKSNITIGDQTIIQVCIITIISDGSLYYANANYMYNV